MGPFGETRAAVIEYEKIDEDDERLRGGCEEQTWEIMRFTDICDEFSEDFEEISEEEVSFFARTKEGFRSVPPKMHKTVHASSAGYSSFRRKRRKQT